jgi:hypothetical protein
MISYHRIAGCFLSGFAGWAQETPFRSFLASFTLGINTTFVTLLVMREHLNGYPTPQTILFGRVVKGVTVLTFVYTATAILRHARQAECRLETLSERGIEVF